MSYEEDYVMDAMALWECIVEENCPRKVYDWMRDGEGAYQARQNALYLVKTLNDCWDIAQDLGWGGAYDWEFIPAVLPIMAEEWPDINKPMSHLFLKHVARLILEDQRSLRTN